MTSDWNEPLQDQAAGWGADAAPSNGIDQQGWGEPGAAESDGGDAIRLGARPDAAVLKQALLNLPQLAGARIDASEVERLPGAAFQVLLVAMRDALLAGGKIRIINPSFAFGLCFEAFGLGGDLEPFHAEYV